MERIRAGLTAVLAPLGLCLVLGSAHAQVTTGKIVGTVRDESGAVLPNVTLRVSPQDLGGRPGSTQTSNRGRYRFPTLPPGLYDLEASLAGFEPHRASALRVEVGGTLEQDIVLELAGVSEEVRVIEPGPTIDPRKPGFSTNYDAIYVRNIPRLRTDVADFPKMAPGMSATRPASANPDVSAFGSGVNENRYVIDGADRTDPRSFQVPYLLTDAIEEVELVSVGASAEYGNFQGAVFNIVTRQGGRDWRFDVSYFNQNDTLTSQPVTLDCRCPAGETGYANNLRHDFSALAGGPVVPERLWLFGGYQYRELAANQPGTDPRFTPETFDRRLIEKLNWQITPRLKLLQTFQDGFDKIPVRPTSGDPFETSNKLSVRYSVFAASLDSILSKNTLVDFHISAELRNVKREPNSGNRTLSYRVDLATGLASGGARRVGEVRRKQIPVRGKITHFAEDFLGADHEFKFGAQFSHTTSDEFLIYPGGGWFADYAGAPFQASLREPVTLSEQSRNLGLFAEDVLTVGNRLTLSLGARLDINHASSQDAPAIDLLGNETGGIVEGLGTVFEWDTISPRLGINWRLSTDGRTVLRSSWGRYYHGTFTAEFLRFHPGNTPLVVARFDPATGEYSNILRVINPPGEQDIVPGILPPHTDQFSIGLDREVGRSTALAVSYIRKDGRDFTGWVDVGGSYGSETVTIEDGRSLTVFPLLNSPFDQHYRLTNPDGWFLRYNGLLVTLNKRWSHRWQALVSYSLSKAVGLQRGSLTRAGNSQLSSGSSGNAARDPNDLIFAEGNLSNDRTHMFRTQAVVEIPKIDVVVGANFQFLSGTPWAATALVSLPQGFRLIFIEPPGSRRLPSQSLLDLRISKMFEFRGGFEAQLLVDILNTLNETASQSILTSNLFSPNFAEGLSPVEPRRAMIGIKVTF